MHFLNLVKVLLSFNNVKVEFIPASGCSYLWDQGNLQEERSADDQKQR